MDPFTSASINNLAPSLIVKYEAETVDDGIGGSGFMVLPNNYATKTVLHIARKR